MSELLYDPVSQKQKLSAVICAGAILIGIVLCSVARYVATVNDWLSGPPDYVRSIANMMAEDMAKKFTGLRPVVATANQDEDCQPVKTASSIETADIFLISYSERLRSLCVTLLHTASPDLQENRVLTIGPATGHNYGRQLQSSIRVVPIQRYPAHFPGAFLSSLHWRPNAALEATSQGLQPSDPLIRSELQGFSINMNSLRHKVAERHNFMNRLLSLSLGLMIAAFVVAAWRLGVLYRRVRRDCALFGFRLGLVMYLRTTISDIAAQAHESYCAQHCQQQAQLRAERIFRHTLDTTRMGLQALLETAPDRQERAQIQSCLQRGDLAEMKGLLEHLENRPTQRTPEERLSSLLESLKEYCVDSEFDSCRKTAFELLQNRGFREARDFVVHAHDELRRKAREAERDKMEEKNSTPDGALLKERNGSNYRAPKPSLRHSGK